MYSISLEARDTYYRLKVLEILVYLYYFDTANEQQKNFYGRQYCISSTGLKATFKGVYGVSIGQYMKEYRIREAASMLLKTQESIGCNVNTKVDKFLKV
ncbi:hypothetical protein CHH77_16805 [Shouchella clausii]|uniref:helix-turn-helix domain-containing protein n=1 Tax=Shouchella TaxID=2893057 RepID=UPI000BA5691A|nr:MULTISPECIES: AraC family transcriptional regulator [Shouchella]MCM3381213.1 AraC family transcriptional regulator [Shouchella rhizosphaerae]PAE80405.1 hypothetical protein CHH77_16805 [Shouchella clausii]